MSENYAEFEAYMNERGLTDARNRAELRRLRTLDVRCERCYDASETDERMLCAGVRLYFRDDMTRETGRTQIVNQRCPKLLLREERARLEKGWETSLVWETERKACELRASALSLSGARRTPDGILFGDALLPTLTRSMSTLAVSERVVDLIRAACSSGLSARYQYGTDTHMLQTLSRSPADWVRILARETDLLVLQGFDATYTTHASSPAFDESGNLATTRITALLHHVVSVRARGALPTIVVWNRTPQPVAGARIESELLDLISSWPKIPSF